MEPWVEGSLLADGGDSVALIVVRGIDQRRVRQLEQPTEDRFVLLARVAILEVGAAGPANEQRVTGKHPVRHDKTVGIVSMSGCIDDIERKPFDCEFVAFAKPHRDHVGLSLFAHYGDALGTVAQRPKACDVVGMQVRIHRLNQL